MHLKETNTIFKPSEGYEKNGTRCVSFKSIAFRSLVCGGFFEEDFTTRRSYASKAIRPLPPPPIYKFTPSLSANERVSQKYLGPKERKNLTKFILVSRSNKSFIIQSVVNKKYVKQSATGSDSEISDDDEMHSTAGNSKSPAYNFL